jgi:hypothetical protein
VEDDYTFSLLNTWTKPKDLWLNHLSKNEHYALNEEMVLVSGSTLLDEVGLESFMIFVEDTPVQL